MVSPPLESPSDSPLSPEISPPGCQTSVRQSYRVPDMVGTATNEVGPLAILAAIAAAPVATLRSAIASDENAPGMFLRVYEDLRDHIVQSRQTTYSEVPATISSDLSTNIDQHETRLDSLSSACRAFRIRIAAAEDRVRHLESLPVWTAQSLNIRTPTPLVPSVPYSLFIRPVINAQSSQVGAAAQTPTNPHISTPISHSNVSATTPYSLSPPLSTIPNTMLSHNVIYERLLRGELPIPMSQLHPTHAHSSLRTPQAQTRYTIPPVSLDSNPNAPCFSLSTPLFRTVLPDFTTNDPYSLQMKISNFIVSSENSRDSSRRSSRSTVLT